MLKPGLVSATFKTLNCSEVIALAKRAGLVAIEWSENHHIPLDESFAKGVGEESRAAGLEIAAYGSYFRLGKQMDIIPSLKNAKALGASVVRIWAGEKKSSEVTQEERKGLIEEARRVAELASSYGITLALEWHKNTLTDTNDSGLAFLKEVDRENLKTLWQPTRELTIAEREKGIGMILPYLVNVHTYHWDQVGRLTLKEGEDEWKRYIPAFDNEDRYMLLEFVKNDTVEQFLEDAETLKGWIKKYGRS